MQENWKDIKGYEGLYQVSDLGNIKSFCFRRGKKEIILKPSNAGLGYSIVGLSKNKKRKAFYIHRLVIQHFTIVWGQEVNHINGNKKDNRLINLEWVTKRENQSYRSTLKGRFTGTKRYKSKWTAQVYFNGKDIYLGVFPTEQEANNAYKEFLLSNGINNKYK